MSDSSKPTSPLSSSRRSFVKATGGIAAASAFTGATIPNVFAQGSETVQIAFVGCGGRGTGAAAQALSVKNANTKIVAMADVFENRLQSSANTLEDNFKDKKDKFDVPQERRFIGFEAYKQAMDCLKPGDIVILTTPVAFRWVHFKYAIEKGLHVFMEKPVTVDGPSTRKMLALAEEADKKNLKCGVGLMVRHCRGRQELKKRIDDGEIGDILTMRAYRMHGPVATCFSERKPEGEQEVMFQIRRFHSFLWASGGLFNDFYIHQIDETCWMKGKWPVKAQALGGRHYRGNYVDQNFDSYAVEYTFDDGTKLFMDGRTINGCYNDMSSVVHGTKGAGIVSMAGHTPGKVRTFNTQVTSRSDRAKNLIWAYPQPEENPYQLEWDDFLDAIANDKPYNEVKRGAEASLVSNMGRLAAHTGQEVTFEEALNHEHEFAPDVDKLTPDGPAPVMPDENGRYPVPEPGIKKNREY